MTRRLQLSKADCRTLLSIAPSDAKPCAINPLFSRAWLVDLLKEGLDGGPEGHQFDPVRDWFAKRVLQAVRDQKRPRMKLRDNEVALLHAAEEE